MCPMWPMWPMLRLSRMDCRHVKLRGLRELRREALRVEQNAADSLSEQLFLHCCYYALCFFCYALQKTLG